jgi:hypothetical protein
MGLDSKSLLRQNAAWRAMVARQWPQRCMGSHSGKTGDPLNPAYRCAHAGYAVSAPRTSRVRLSDSGRDLASQPLKTEQGVGAGLRDFGALESEVFAEEFNMRRALMELLWGQHGGEDRHLGA